MISDIVWLTFTVDISKTEYGYQSIEGTATAKFQFPRALLKDLDGGNLLVSLLPGALAELEVKELEAESESEE